MATANMNLTLPTVSVTTGPTYATEVNTAFETVDSHNHSPGYGALVPTSGLNINADLSMGGYNLSSLAQAKFTTTSTALTVARSLGFVSSELWARDGSGNNVQITSSGQLNTGTFTQIATPSSPASGYNKLYPKTDNKFYILTSGGIESQLLTGASTQTVNSLTSNTTLTSSYSVVLCSASGGAFTVTLPSVSSNPGQVYKIKKTDSTVTNAVTIARNGGDTFQESGATVTSTTLNTQGEEIELISDGSSTWQILNRKNNGPAVSFTPTGTGGFTTNTTYTGYWRRVGNSAQIYVRMSFAGAPNATSAIMDLPNSWTINTSALPTLNANISSLGTYGQYGSATGLYAGGDVRYASSTTVKCWFAVGGATGKYQATDESNPFVIANTDILWANFTVPITGWNS